jgi:hypothetical protein
MNFKLFKKTLLFLFGASFLVCGANSAQAGKVIFECPDLHNKKKRSIEHLYQGFDGWFFRDNDLKMDFSISPESQDYFRHLNEALSSRGIKLYLLPLLSRTLMAPTMVNTGDPWQQNYNVNLARESYKNFTRSIESHGVKVISLEPLFKTYENADPYIYNFKRDIHWKPTGSLIVAQVLSAELKKFPSYGTLSKVKTVSRKREEVGRAGTIMEEIQKLCVGNIEAEVYNPYEAERVLDKSADALFGDASSTVPIALIGTSFSAVDEFNFLPFLEENSGLEVASFSIPGGGMFTSLISYLSSPFFQSNLPPLIIWETQSVYNFNKGTEYGFREAIPAVAGPCDAERAVAKNTLNLRGVDKPYILLENLKGKKATGNGYYLHIFADNLGLRKFALEMDYDDQDGEWFPVDRSDRYNNQGHFYIELSDKISGNLDTVTMKDAGNTVSKVEITLCRKDLPKTPKTKTEPTKENQP